MDTNKHESEKNGQFGSNRSVLSGFAWFTGSGKDAAATGPARRPHSPFRLVLSAGVEEGMYPAGRRILRAGRPRSSYKRLQAVTSGRMPGATGRNVTAASGRAGLSSYCEAFRVGREGGRFGERQQR